MWGIIELNSCVNKLVLMCSVPSLVLQILLYKFYNSCIINLKKIRIEREIVAKFSAKSTIDDFCYLKEC